MQKSINWDNIPDVINKDQFYQICHISKQTARYLLNSGKVPCKIIGHNRHCYKIKKEDVENYLRDRLLCPEDYTAPPGWYGTNVNKSTGLPKKLSAKALRKLHSYYTALLVMYPDMMSTDEIVSLTGYHKSTVNIWCHDNRLPHLVRHRTYYIPKTCLIDYFCSEGFRTICHKTKWHIHTLQDFYQRLQESPNCCK